MRTPTGVSPRLETMTENKKNDPIARFQRLLDRAISAEIPNANGMTLSTVDSQGRPSSRMVLLKGFDPSGFVFYTNLESRKAVDLQSNPQVSLLFYWRQLDRQVRIEGSVELVSDQEADAYFASRDRMSQVGAWASSQSRPLSNRAELLAQAARFEAKFAGAQVPRPPHWSGFRVNPSCIEFWKAGAFRLHKRTVFDKNTDGWDKSMLYP